MKKKALSLFLALALCVGLITPAFAAYSDTAGHWAEASIARWSDYNIVSGYDGSFAPDGDLTRGQMAKILADLLGLPETAAANPFTDVAADAWYTPYVLRCYAAGILRGDGETARPLDSVTRQEAMVLYCRALGIAPAADADLSAYTDGGDVAAWAAPYVAAMVRAGIISGVGDNQLAPVKAMSRAETMTVLDKAITQYINAPGSYALTDGKGIVLVAAGDVKLSGQTSANILVTAAASGKTVAFEKAVVTGSVTVQADNAKVTKDSASTLPAIAFTGQGSTETTTGAVVTGGSIAPSYTDLTIKADQEVAENATYKNVTVSDTVGDGTVTLSKLTIEGDLIINGGGSHTVNVVDCTIKGKIIVNKTAEGETPRLLLTETPVKTVEVETPAIIETADDASAIEAVTAKAELELKGDTTTVETITVPAAVEDKVEITVTGGSVGTVEAKSETSVTGAANSVAAVVAEAPVSVAAATVEKVEVPETAPENVTVAVTGSGNVEVAVNSGNAVAVTADDADNVTVSTALDTAPEVTVNEVAVAHVHKWDEGEVTASATCTEAGTKTFTCTAEGCDVPAATKTESIPAKGHTEIVDAAVAATCTEAGKTEGKHCSVCNAIIVAQETVDALGHTVVTDEAVEPTCIAEGKTEGSHCSVCGLVIVAQESVEPIEHLYSDMGYDEECHWWICNTCGEADKDAQGEVYTSPHFYEEEVTKEPTTEETGIKTYTCYCGKTMEEVLPKRPTDPDPVQPITGIRIYGSSGYSFGIKYFPNDDTEGITGYRVGVYDSAHREESIVWKDGGAENTASANAAYFNVTTDLNADYNYDRVEVVSVADFYHADATWSDGSISLSQSGAGSIAIECTEARHDGDNMSLKLDCSDGSFEVEYYTKSGDTYTKFKSSNRYSQLGYMSAPDMHYWTAEEKENLSGDIYIKLSTSYSEVECVADNSYAITYYDGSSDYILVPKTEPVNAKVSDWVRIDARELPWLSWSAEGSNAETAIYEIYLTSDGENAGKTGISYVQGTSCNLIEMLGFVNDYESLRTFRYAVITPCKQTDSGLVKGITAVCQIENMGINGLEIRLGGPGGAISPPISVEFEFVETTEENGDCYWIWLPAMTSEETPSTGEAADTTAKISYYCMYITPGTITEETLPEGSHLICMPAPVSPSTGDQASAPTTFSYGISGPGLKALLEGDGATPYLTIRQFTRGDNLTYEFCELYRNVLLTARSNG